MSAATRARGAQTDFRESETQTQPWTPPYTTYGRTTPEVLRLGRLTWGDGLPPGQHEVEVVERLRMKQAWEAQLPPLDTEANIKKRFKLIADMEKNDWEFREKEIQAIHDERMKKSEQLLEQHMQLNRTRLSYRMAFLEDDINKRKEKKLQLIHRDKERALRKLCMREKGYNPKHHKMNIVDEHLCHTSETYAPMKRYGTSFKNKHEILAEKSISVDDEDIYALEEAITFRPAFDFNKASQPKKQTELCVRETRWTMENLVKLHQDLQMLRAKQNKNLDAFYTQALEQIHKPTKIRNVASVPLTSDAQERLHQAAITIQRVIHGRAMQMQIHQGRDIWREMMEEIKGADSLSTKQREGLFLLKDHMIHNTRAANMMENLVGMNVGSTIGKTLNLLATELLRFKNEGMDHNQALLPEHVRRTVEEAEGGRRQREAVRRQEHNLMFAQLLEVYQESINELLEGIVSKAREHEAKVQAYEYAKEMALLAELARAAMEETEEEPVSADLLLEFIAPEGLRDLTRTCMLILKQKYAEARWELVRGGRARPLEEEVEGEEEGESLSPAEGTQETQPRDITPSATYMSTSTFSYRASDLYRTPSPSGKVQREVSATEGMSETPHMTEGTWEMTRTSGTDTEAGTTLPEERTSSDATTPQPPARFGLAAAQPAGGSHEDRLLAKVMRDMCYVAGYLLHTAAKILNKALQLSSLPRESFEEALRRTMQVINGAREEIARLILPKRKPQSFILPSKIASEGIILEATKIVDDIISKVRERIVEARGKDPETSATDMTVPQIVVESEIQSHAKQIIEDILKDAQRKVIQVVAEDFLADLLKEAKTKVDYVTGDWHSSH